MRSSLDIVLRRSYDGGAWHGPALADALAGVDAHAALARPVPTAHTIWELTHHLMAWTREVTRRLHGGEAAMPVEGDWPEPVPETDAAALDAEWARLRASLLDARDVLLETLGAFPAERLDAPVSAIGEPVSYGQMLIGLAEHNAYHGGQIVLLRRALADAGPAGAGERGTRDAAQITES